MIILETCNLQKTFSNKKVLDGISIHLNEGEIVGLLGVSGTGKSTIFNIISGNILPDSGQVFLKGEDITGKTGQVSYMLQKDLLLKHLTAVDNAALPLILQGIKKDVARRQAMSYFKDFEIEGIEDKYPSQISGGMRQRIALLRTYLNKKDVILLDEPFSALDMFTKSKIHEWFLKMTRKFDISGLFISHDIEEAIYLSNRIYILNKSGKIEREVIIKDEARDENFKLSDRFLDYKREISQIIGQ